MNGKLFALFSVTLFVITGCAVMLHTSDESDAAVSGSGTLNDPYTNWDVYVYEAWGDLYYSSPVYVTEGAYISFHEGYWDEDGYMWEVTSVDSGRGLTTSGLGGNMRGTVTGTGPVNIRIECWTDEDTDAYSLSFIVIDPSCTVSFNANGGTATSSSQTAGRGSQITLPSASKAYSTFAGWYIAASGGTRVGGAGDAYTVTGNTTLYAQYNVIPVYITSSQADEYVIQGSSFSYTVSTSPADAAVSVSGASWLSVSGKTVSGTPGPSVAAGVYHVTVTANYGTQTAVQSFDITVVQKLIFESVPTGGIIAIPV